MLLGSVIDASDAFGIIRRSSPDTPVQLARVIDASDAFGVIRRSSPDMPNLVGSSTVSPMGLDKSLLSDVHSLDVVGSVINGSDAFGVSRRSSPDTPELARYVPSISDGAR
ncbi:hypothetical protein M405DRAFT_866811 [Rhizopogon salebrosus TDB-379]|nr:hypothetical protein M405DRAFT_866811 [Rhizopogon salebrosus TDB-379]